MASIRGALDSDVDDILSLARRTGVFTSDEIEVVKELVEQEVGNGDQDDYHSFVARENGQIVGFVCYGPTAMTQGTYDLYWIFVDPEEQHTGVGRALLAEIEKAVVAAKGRMLVAETSSTRPYLPARRFYLKHGFRRAGQVKDFYRPGDSRVVYVKRFS
jgi:ribosomal protein S18 acetylase RimI-like enzyme